MSVEINKNECNYIDIARFVGIWLVVLGHFPFNGSDIFFRNLIYTCHMPLFFLISGMLHKQEPLSFSVIKKIFISLIVPYYIYNFICALILYPINPVSPIDTFIGIFKCIGDQTAGPTWFLLSLFWIKIIASFLNKKYLYILISLICIFILYCLKDINQIKGISTLIFRIKPAIGMFPFFAIGYLFKTDFLLKKNQLVNIFIILGSFIFISVIAYHFGKMGTNIGYKRDFVFAYLAGFLGSIAIIYLSQYILPLIKGDFIKTISRGTIIIVGLHGLLTDLIRWYLPDIQFLYSCILSLFITLLFYIPIKLTYKRIPILFGKIR